MLSCEMFMSVSRCSKSVCACAAYWFPTNRVNNKQTLMVFVIFMCVALVGNGLKCIGEFYGANINNVVRL